MPRFATKEEVGKELTKRDLSLKKLHDTKADKTALDEVSSGKADRDLVGA